MTDAFINMSNVAEQLTCSLKTPEPMQHTATSFYASVPPGSDDRPVNVSKRKLSLYGAESVLDHLLELEATAPLIRDSENGVWERLELKILPCCATAYLSLKNTLGDRASLETWLAFSIEGRHEDRCNGEEFYKWCKERLTAKPTH